MKTKEFKAKKKIKIKMASQKDCTQCKSPYWDTPRKSEKK